jgi:hypothetical protein
MKNASPFRLPSRSAEDRIDLMDPALLTVLPRVATGLQLGVRRACSDKLVNLDRGVGIPLADARKHLGFPAPGQVAARIDGNRLVLTAQPDAGVHRLMDIDARGRLTVPAGLRRRLGLDITPQAFVCTDPSASTVTVIPAHALHPTTSQENAA